MAYIDGFVIAVPNDNKEAYLKQAKWFAEVVKELGATRVVECWGSELQEGKVTDFRRAVKAEEGENVVFSWVEYPSKEIRDAATTKIMADPRMQDMKMPFDGSRMIMGGFETIVDT